LRRFENPHFGSRADASQIPALALISCLPTCQNPIVYKGLTGIQKRFEKFHRSFEADKIPVGLPLVSPLSGWWSGELLQLKTSLQNLLIYLAMVGLIE